MFYLVSYDIKDDSRRLKTMKVLKNYGTRVQYSVFECILANDRLKKLKSDISKVVNCEMDSIRIYSIPENARKEIIIIGVGKVARDENFYVI
jgi:CRISPR-associated protein Cas2